MSTEEDVWRPQTAQSYLGVSAKPATPVVAKAESRPTTADLFGPPTRTSSQLSTITDADKLPRATVSMVRNVREMPVFEIEKQLREKLVSMKSTRIEQRRWVTGDFQKLGAEAAHTQHETELRLNQDQFRAYLKQMNFPVSKDQATAFFAQADLDKDGFVSVTDFMDFILPLVPVDNIPWSEYTRPKPPQKLHVIEEFPPSLAKWKPTLADLEKQLQRKVDEKTSRRSDRVRQIFKIFEGGHHASKLTDKEAQNLVNVSQEEFHEVLQLLGMVVTREESDQLFQKYSTASGLNTETGRRMSMSNFLTAAMPSDYTQDAKSPWSKEEPRKVGVARKTGSHGVAPNISNPNTAGFESWMNEQKQLEQKTARKEQAKQAKSPKSEPFESDASASVERPLTTASKNGAAQAPARAVYTPLYNKRPTKVAGAKPIVKA